MQQPTISSIITAYNQERYLAEAIESARAQQGAFRQEIIVVDDGSTDETGRIARSFKEVRYIFQENSGHGSALNTGINHSSGSLLAFLDGDDLWMPDKLSRQLAAVESDPNLDLVQGHVVEFYCPVVFKETRKPEREPVPGPLVSATLMRRRLIQKIGRVNTELKLGAVIDWLIRAREAGVKQTMLPDVLLRRRIHDDNIGIREADARSDYVRILKAALDRRRQRSVDDP